MRRVLTGYAVQYNRRYRRHGHLFQNRFKSILCQEDPYLLELVRYIHLNPLRAGIVADLESLGRYPYCGHSRLLGATESNWQDTGYILRLFGKTVGSARRLYLKFVGEGVAQGRRPDLIGGGLVRSAGGWLAVRAMRKRGAYQKGDERILGDGDFVDETLVQAEESLERKFHLKAKGYDFGKVVDRVGELTGVGSAEVLSSGKNKAGSTARSILCFWAVRELGMRQNELARLLKVSQPAVSMAMNRGEQIVKEHNFRIIIG